MIHKETDPFYKSRAWRKARISALMRDNFLCVECVAANAKGVRRRPHAAEMVHHVLPIKEYPDLALELSNLQSLCNACHNRLHPEKSEARAPRQDPVYPKGVRIIKI